MHSTGKIDLVKEQQATLNRPRYRYSFAARLFFFSMDVITGKRTTLSKAKLIEILASIPYRSWEIRQYARMTGKYRNRGLVQEAEEIVAWGREAQDNEYRHLLLIDEKMKEDGISDAWYLHWPVPRIMTGVYTLLTRASALVNIRGAFLFNAEFEDHAEHVYAAFAAAHPEWETQPVAADIVSGYADVNTWADVFRRIGLDERDHMNASFTFSGRPEYAVAYQGMP